MSGTDGHVNLPCSGFGTVHEWGTFGDIAARCGAQTSVRQIRYTSPSTLRTEDGASAVRLPNPAAGKGARVVQTSCPAPGRARAKLAMKALEESTRRSPPVRRRPKTAVKGGERSGHWPGTSSMQRQPGKSRSPPA